MTTHSSERPNRIAFIQACWHRDIVDAGRDAFLASIQELGYARDQIELFEVPGTLEIPLLAKQLAKSGRFAAICCPRAGARSRAGPCARA